MGTPEFDVTQSGGGPCAFVAIQSAGSAGGVTPSKFWPECNSRAPAQADTVGTWRRYSSKDINAAPASHIVWRSSRPHCVEEIKCAALFIALSGSQKCCDATLAARTTAMSWRQRYAGSPWTCR